VSRLRIASSRLSGMSAGTEGLGTGSARNLARQEPASQGVLASTARATFPRMAEPTEAGRSFDEEALPHLDALYRVALRLTADPSQAEDLVQDTMLKAYRSWRQYRPGTNAKGWLLTILRNTFINDYRRRKHEPIAMDLEAAEPHALYRSMQESDPEGTFFSQIVDAKVTEAIDALPPDFREVLALSDIEGLSYGEIADTLKIPVGTVKSRLFRARRQLQAELYTHAVEMGYIQERESRT
jgi:RNA polymerase sigma-70 factor (ECF subfamily)